MHPGLEFQAEERGPCSRGHSIWFLSLLMGGHVKVTLNHMGEEGLLWNEKQRLSFLWFNPPVGGLCSLFPCGQLSSSQITWSPAPSHDSESSCQWQGLWYFTRPGLLSSAFRVSAVFSHQKIYSILFFCLCYFSPKMALLLWCAWILMLEWWVFCPQQHFPNQDSYF